MKIASVLILIGAALCGIGVAVHVWAFWLTPASDPDLSRWIGSGVADFAFMVLLGATGIVLWRASLRRA